MTLSLQKLGVGGLTSFFWTVAANVILVFEEL